MNIKTLILGLFITTSIASCNCCDESGDVRTSIRSVPAFESIVTNGNFNVYITPAETQEVKVVADEHVEPTIETEVSNGILTISFKSNTNKINLCKTTADRLDIYISMPSIKSIDLEGSGMVQSTGVLKSTNLSVILNGSGKVILADSCNAATVSCNGSGMITLNGQAKDQTITLGGSGSINASGFETENTTANLSGSGTISTRVTKLLNATLSGSGSIFYYGNPTTVNKNQTGSGVIEGR